MTTATQFQFSDRLRRLTGWAGLLLVIVGVITGLTTFSILTGLTPIKPSRESTTLLLLANGAVLLIMALMIIGQVVFLFVERRKRTPGAGLHLRLVLLFSIIAVVPAVLVAAFATVTLNRGLDAWFSERTQAIVAGAVTVAEAYVRDHAEATRNDTAGIANDLIQQKALFEADRPDFVKRVARHAALRNLPAAFVFNAKEKRIDAQVAARDKVEFFTPPAEALAKADKGELVIIQPGIGGNVVRALIKLQGYDDEYLYIYRLINPAVTDQLRKTREAKAEYDRLMSQRTGVQLTFAMMYGIIGCIFSLAAIWAGLWFADRLAAPVVRLLDAANRISTGDLSAQVAVADGPEDLVTLSRTFNAMTARIKEQRDELVQTNEVLDDRRRFMETVLSSVSAGVVGIDGEGRIALVNKSAQVLLDRTETDLVGKPLVEILPEVTPLYELSKSRPTAPAESQVDIPVRGAARSFLARIATEDVSNERQDRVMTIDDITDLVSAQRNSAWADIARRIAHEIKNPLTPIQLSAERLRRKYASQIQQDRQVFDQCTSTIIRQVGDIGRMVDEFSSFARMPKAQPEPQRLADVVREATVLQRVSTADIAIDLDVREAEFVFSFDRRLITQAITNLVKNARESIEARLQTTPEPSGRILVEAGMQGESPFVRVTDNGIGLPKENRNRLVEPYMTTREKGTGLGLAIVKRIMEEHGGRLILADAPEADAGGTGAAVTLDFGYAPVARADNLVSA